MPQRPIAAIFLALCLAVVGLLIYGMVRGLRKRNWVALLLLLLGDGTGPNPKPHEWAAA